MTTLARKEIENIVEQKVLEMLGDPDAGLELRPSFVKDLKRRLNKSPQKYISHTEVMRRYGLR